MPELPEVQTIVNDLQKSIRDWRVTDFYSLWEKNVSGGKKDFKNRVLGQKVQSVDRKGKYILIKFESGDFIIAHLRMTGSLIVDSGTSSVENRFVRHGWVLEKGKKQIDLLFSDVRKFGTIEFVENNHQSKQVGMQKLGIEPLGRQFTAKKLGEMLQKNPKRKIRGVLLDQQKIAGIGNIYASEILFDAGIYPDAECGSLTKTKTEKLRKSIQKILIKAIKCRGTTISDYRDSQGKQGSFQNRLKVYNKEHERCLRKGCRGIIQKAKLQGRSAFWCSDCQKMKRL